MEMFYLYKKYKFNTYSAIVCYSFLTVVPSEKVSVCYVNGSTVN